MICSQMPLLLHFFKNVRMFPNVVANAEESCLRIVHLQGFKYKGSYFWNRAIIKSEIDSFASVPLSPR